MYPNELNGLLIYDMPWLLKKFKEKTSLNLGHIQKKVYIPWDTTVCPSLINKLAQMRASRSYLLQGRTGELEFKSTRSPFKKAKLGTIQTRAYQNPMKPSIGNEAEALARTYLEDHGLTFIAKNVKYRFGEIDLIMKSLHTFVFIEVKYRSSTFFGGALSAITEKQKKRLQLSALHYLQQHNIDAQARFDVIAIESTQIHWIKNAW